MRTVEPASSEVTFLRVESAFDREHYAVVKQRLEPVMSRPGDVLLDLRGTPVDPAGLGVLLSVRRRLEAAGRRLLLVDDSPQFAALLERAGARSALDLFPDTEQALSFAREQPVLSPAF